MPGGLYPPLSVIESWPKPNYIDPSTQGPALIYLCIVFSSLNLASVTARTYSRIFITKAPGIDDLLVAVATGFSIALSVLIVIQQKNWLTGHHIWDIPPDKFPGQRKNIYICEWFYLTATCSVKISILLFYRRLSVTFSKTFLIATWVGIIYNVLYWVAFVTCLLVLFRPLDSYWLSFDLAWAATHEYTHGSERWSLPLSAGLSVIGDFYATVLPLMLIRVLHLPLRQKAALYALFGLGFFVVAAGIIRTLQLQLVVSKTYDVSWSLWDMWIWTVVELNVAILAASAPALKPFVRRFLIDPITGSGRRTPYAYGSQRRSSAGQAKAAGQFKWSIGTKTARDSNMLLDTEKIGIALTAPQSRAEMIEEEIDDGVSTRRYQLRSSRDGKLVPVQIHEQRSFDARSLDAARSSDAILAPGKMGHFSAPPERKRYQPYETTSLSFSQSQPQSSPHTQNNGADYLRRSLDRTPSPSSSSAAVAQARARAHQRHLQEFSSEDPAFPNTPTHIRSISRGSERNFSLPSTTVVGGSPYQNMFPERIEDGRKSSEDTPGLPRTGSSNGTSNGTRPVSVGYAV